MFLSRQEMSKLVNFKQCNQFVELSFEEYFFNMIINVLINITTDINTCTLRTVMNYCDNVATDKDNNKNKQNIYSKF